MSKRTFFIEKQSNCWLSLTVHALQFFRAIYQVSFVKCDIKNSKVKTNQSKQQINQSDKSNKIAVRLIIILSLAKSRMFKNCIVILSLIISVCCIEISPEWNQASLAQKRKVYCLMISYHFLDDDMDAFNSLTTNLSSFRVQIFRNRVAYKLSDNCQAKITNEQIMELSKLIEKPSGHEEEIETLEHKYIQYFAPEQDYVLNLVKEVKLQSEVDIKKQIEKFHQTRRHIQSNTGVLIDGFKAVQNHINTTGHHILNVLDNFYKAFHKVHHQINETVHKIKNHPEIKKIQDFWDDL